MATHSSILVWRIPMDRGAWQAWQATVLGVEKSWTRRSDLAQHSTSDCFSWAALEAVGLRQQQLLIQIHVICSPLPQGGDASQRRFL